MKIRNGFVSNSSSSSFAVYGAEENTDSKKFIRLLKELSVEKYNEYMRYFVRDNEDINIDDIDELLKNDEFIEYIEDDFGELAYYICDAIGDGYEHFITEDTCIIGKNYNNIGDDETGGQFRNSVLESLKQLGATKCQYYEEVSYNY